MLWLALTRGESPSRWGSKEFLGWGMSGHWSNVAKKNRYCVILDGRGGGRTVVSWTTTFKCWISLESSLRTEFRDIHENLKFEDKNYLLFYSWWFRVGKRATVSKTTTIQCWVLLESSSHTDFRYINENLKLELNKMFSIFVFDGQGRWGGSFLDHHFQVLDLVGKVAVNWM